MSDQGIRDTLIVVKGREIVLILLTVRRLNGRLATISQAHRGQHCGDQDNAEPHLSNKKTTKNKNKIK